VSAWSLLRALRLRTLARTLTAVRGPQRLQRLSLALVGLVVFGGVLAITTATFGALREVPDGPAIAEAAIAGSLTVAVFVELFFGLTTAVYTLYLSHDLPLLATMPIRERTVFAYKYWETLAANATLYGVLWAPFLLGYGFATRAGAAYYPLLALTSVLVLMIPTGLSILLIMPVMRLVPAGRAKEIIAVVWTLIGIGVWATFQMLTRPGRESMLNGQYCAVLDAPVFRVPPGRWGADVLLGAAAGDWSRMLGGLLPLVSLALAMFGIALAIVPWAYTAGWVRAGESGRRVRGAGWTGLLFGRLPGDLRAVVIKDLTAFPRDLRQLAGMAAVAAVGIVITLVNGPMTASPSSSALSSFLPYLTVGGIGGLGASQAANLAIGGEGRAYWLLAAAPIRTWRLLLAKWIVAFFLGICAVTLALLVISLRGFSVTGLLVGLGAGALTTALIATYAIGISASFPRFDWDNPRYAVSTLGGLILGVCIFWMASAGGAAAGLVYLLVASVPLGAALLAGILAWLLAAAIPAVLLLALGHRRLSRMDWDL